MSVQLNRFIGYHIKELEALNVHQSDTLWCKVMKMGNDINTFTHTSSTGDEIHRSCYVLLRTTFGFFLIRICLCGRYVDKSYLQNKAQLDMFDTGDGVEFHFYGSCRYKQSNQTGDFALRLVCYCPKQEVGRMNFYFVT